VKTFLEEHRPTVVVPSPVLPEFSYLAGRYLPVQAELEVLRSIYMGQMAFEPLRADDLPRVIDILDTYRDAKVGFVDAAVAAIAERLRVSALLTLDRRHFGMIQAKAFDSFDVYP